VCAHHVFNKTWVKSRAQRRERWRTEEREKKDREREQEREREREIDKEKESRMTSMKKENFMIQKILKPKKLQCFKNCNKIACSKRAKWNERSREGDGWLLYQISYARNQGFIYKAQLCLSCSTKVKENK
jgi:hypothetical protein